MKKLILITLALSLFLSMLVGCNPPSGGTGGGGDDSSGASEGLTDAEKNRMTLAKELANEVDGVKNLTAILSDNSLVNGGVGKEGIRVEKTAFIRDENALDKDQSMTSYDWVDDIVKKLKSSKNQAIEVCKCLNTWVKIGDGDYSAVYRINYDANTDTVTVEYHSHLSDFNSYQKFTVTLDTNGKSVIDYYSTGYQAEYITDSTELHYYEDKYYFSLSEHRLEDGTIHENTMFLDMENKVQATVIVNKETYYENGIPVREEYQAPKIEFSYEDEKYKVSAGAEGGSLAYRSEEGYESGGYIGGSNKNGFSLNLSLFEGWSAVSRDGDYVTLATEQKGDVRSIGFTQNFLGEENGVRYSYQIPYYDIDEYVYIWVEFEGGESLSTKERTKGAFAVLERELELTIDGELKEDFVNVSDRHSELLESFHFINGIYAKDIKTAEDYFEVLDALRLEKLSFEELKVVYDGKGINRNEQQPENSYFEFLSFTLSGNATVNEEAKSISLAGITAEIAPSLMLVDGGEYSLVFAFNAPGVIYEIGAADATYNGEALSFESSVEITAEALLKEFGEYRLVAFIALKSENKHDRISKLYDVTAEGAAAFSNVETHVTSNLVASEEGVTLTNTKTPVSDEGATPGEPVE